MMESSRSFKQSLFRAKREIFILLTTMMIGLAFAQETLPQGWRKPVAAEVPGDWREKSPAKFLTVRGDFDGDGKVDVAELLVNQAGTQFGLFVKRSAAPGWEQLEKGQIRQLDNLGIDLVKPGKHETAC